LTTSKFKPQIFYVWLRLFLCCENIHSRNFVWLLFVACTILLYNCYTRKIESRMQIADRCAPWKISNGAENLVL
jgi:hypothetical protein